MKFKIFCRCNFFLPVRAKDLSAPRLVYRIIVAPDNTQWHINTLGRTSLDDGSACHRDLYLTTPHSQETDFYSTGGIPINGAVPDPSLRPRGHRDRPSPCEISQALLESVFIYRYRRQNEEKHSTKTISLDWVSQKLLLGGILTLFSTLF